jgi:hypothetical protein
MIDLFALLFCAGTIVFNRRWVEQVMEFWVIDRTHERAYRAGGYIVSAAIAAFALTDLVGRSL